VLVQVRRSFVKLAAGDRRAGEIDAAANNQIDGGRWREMRWVGCDDAVPRECLKLEAASAMGELESRTGLNNMSRNSDGGGGRLGARRATAQRSARRLGGGSGLDDCDGTMGR
jgi:hypothetical protein